MFKNLNAHKEKRLGFISCWGSVITDILGLMVFESILGIVYLVITYMKSGPLESPEIPIFVNLIATIGGIGYTSIAAFNKYKWKPVDVGIIFTKNAIREYFVGAAIALVMLIGSILPGIIAGAAKLSFTEMNSAVFASWCLFGVGFVIQSFSEEFLCRGVLFKRLKERYDIWVVLILQALIFMGMHAGNPGMGIIPYINLFLVGVVFGQVVLITDNLWLASGLHWLWNFAQGCVFGIKVSGMEGMPTLLTCDMIGSEMLTGGAFGIEGALSATIVYIITIIIFMPKTLKVVREKSTPILNVDNNKEAPHD